MRHIALKIAVAFFGFAIGVISASLFIIRHRQPAEIAPVVTPVITLPRPTHPEGWHKIDVPGRFSFYLPPDMKELQEVMMVDYFGPHKDYGNKSLEINYTYVDKSVNEEMWRGKVSCEMFTSLRQKRPGYRSSEIQIGGRARNRNSREQKSLS
jgi:hypothetical protein